MTSLDNDINQHFQDAIDVIQQHSSNSYYESDCTYYETLTTQQPSLQCQISCCFVTHPFDVPPPAYDWNDVAQPWPQVIPDAAVGQSGQSDPSNFYSILPSQKNKGRKKVRLYEYLHEALNDPTMGESIQWTDSGSGTFQFISKNKEKLAECWGQRKGNRKTMTYQKMARALRNYSRTGEIIKVRRKLTYQFNPDILHRLSSLHAPLRLTCQPAHEEAHAQQQQQQQQQHPAEQSYCSSASVDWHNWYGHYRLQEDCDPAAGFSPHSITKL